jgi:hypothetical protein
MRLYRASLLSLITVTDENMGSTPISRSSGAFPDRRSGRTDASPEHLQLNTVPVEVHDFYCEASAMPKSNTVSK